MAKTKYTRTPETNQLVKDDALEVENLLILPEVDINNIGEQVERAIGVNTEKQLIYHNGTSLVPLAGLDHEVIINITDSGLGVTANSSVGSMTVDFTLFNRIFKFTTRPTILLFQLDGDIETYFKDFSYTYDRDSNILSLDGIFGEKYLVLKP